MHIINENSDATKALLMDIKGLLTTLLDNSANQWGAKKMLKSKEVKSLLGVSHGTLQRYRNEGILPYTKIGGIIFYSYDDVIGLINQKDRDK